MQSDKKILVLKFLGLMVACFVLYFYLVPKFYALTFEGETYTECGCGCCPTEDVYHNECISVKELKKIVERDRRKILLNSTPICSNVGCTAPNVYIRCK